MLALSLVLLLHAAPQSVRADTTRAAADSLAADSTRARRAQRLEAVQVTAVRGDRVAIPEKTITRAELQRRYTGQETPILLQAAPGITAYSESGSASNYSYMRLRGIDQTRINITLDGIPLNEPEDEGLYFSNFPDFANSIASVQVQRGVGSSTHGVASYAGSVSFESVPVASVAPGAELQLTRGAYATSRASAVYQTGLTGGGFAGYVRGSAQHTDGYRANSGNRSQSAFASGGWFGARDVVKATLLAGISENQQAYLASPLSVLEQNPRDNPYGNTPATAVGDRFHQDLLSLAWTHALAPALSLATTAYGFDAGGWYDVPGANGLADASNYNLHSRWGGVISALDWSGDAASASLGVHVSRYAREHFLLTRPQLDTRAYDNTGYKGEQSAFAKGAITRGRVTWSGDVQLRFAQFRYRPTEGAGVAPASVRWSFLNPKAGVSVRVNDALTAFATAGLNGREPTRADMFAGADDVDSVTARSVFPLTRVRPESVRDLEAGATWRGATFSAQANLFLMQFHDEIAPIGAINEIGYLLRKNVDRSVRRGVEGDLTWRVTPRVTTVATVALTDTRIHEYVDDASGLVFRNVTALLTPKVVSGHGIRTELASWLSFDADGRYTSRMMLTNTNDARFVVPASWYADAGLTLRAGRAAVLVQLRNVFDRRVYTSGYPGPAVNSTDPNAMEPYYYTLAARNLTVNARLGF
ncbi:MAG: TonB-dependent receptor plug domain-containing protein [Gemmatimonadaceae bacterium]|nr:TonB-dependent receptor plug domain-containing protein [Gemmatimonadaceae bacterium]